MAPDPCPVAPSLWPLWPLAYGPCGPRPVAPGPWPVAPGLRPLACSLWLMAPKVWPPAYGRQPLPSHAATWRAQRRPGAAQVPVIKTFLRRLPKKRKLEKSRLLFELLFGSKVASNRPTSESGPCRPLLQKLLLSLLQQIFCKIFLSDGHEQLNGPKSSSSNGKSSRGKVDRESSYFFLGEWP